MQTKRDQVQAHLFVMGRLTSSMLRADPDAPESPQGRTNRGTAIGVVVTVLICAGAFVFGLIKPGVKDSWRAAGTLVVDRDIGSRYLYLDGRLRPVRNHASARLLLGAEMKTIAVGSGSLRDTPHGPPVGIPGAPDALPKPDDLSTDPWLVCSRPTVTPAGTSDKQKTTTTLAVASDADGQDVGGGRALLVEAPDGTAYLVWRGSRLRLDAGSRAAASLGYGSVAPLRVSAAFLSALPAGPDLTPVAVPGRGEHGPDLSGQRTRVGQLFRITVPGAAPQMHLLRRDGLVPLTDTAAALLLGDPTTRDKAYDGGTVVVRQLRADAIGGHVVPGKSAPGPGAGLPASPPRPATVAADRTPCVQVRPGRDGTRVRVSLVREDSLGPVTQPPAEHVAAACLPVDRVTVPAGGGALVRVLGAAGVDVGSTTYLVTDSGLKYRVPDEKALQALGHASASATALPSLLLSMLPTGPDLTETDAAAGRATLTAPRCAESGAARGGKTAAQDPGSG
jgi:type VII secretion protein EccB